MKATDNDVVSPLHQCHFQRAKRVERSEKRTSAGDAIPQRIPGIDNVHLDTPRGKTAVKDIIEACGIPHTEVDLIMVERANDPSPGAVDMAWLLDEAAEVDVYPAPVEDDVHPWAPRLQTRPRLRFVADGHLGKLARKLRLLGDDPVYGRGA